MKSEIWFYEKGFYKCYVEELEYKEKLLKLEGVKSSCHYSYPNGKNAWDFILPCRLYNKVAELVGLPKKKKNFNRVRMGKKMAIKNLPKSENVLK